MRSGPTEAFPAMRGTMLIQGLLQEGQTAAVFAVSGSQCWTSRVEPSTVIVTSRCWNSIESRLILFMSSLLERGGLEMRDGPGLVS